MTNVIISLDMKGWLSKFPASTVYEQDLYNYLRYTFVLDQEIVSCREITCVCCGHKPGLVWKKSVYKNCKKYQFE